MSSKTRTSDLDWEKINFGERIQLDELVREDVRSKLDDFDYVFVLRDGRACDVYRGGKATQQDFVRSVYFGCLSPADAEKTLGRQGFGLYHRHPGSLELYLTLPLFAVYRAGPDRCSHLPVETVRRDGGQVFYRLGDLPKSPQFPSLEELLRHHFE